MSRYLMQFDTKQIPNTTADVLIVGGGIAGLYSALMLPKDLNIIILSKNTMTHSNSFYAQGGIAAPIDKNNDSPAKHFEDTMICGKNVCDTEALWTMVKEADENIQILMQLGVKFDIDSKGIFKLAREGGHKVSRILHVGGDQTGAKIMDVLYDNIQHRKNVTFINNAFAIDLLTNQNTCYGVLAQANNDLQVYYANYTILATGGIGQIFDRTTNAGGIQGDGIAMAIRAGAKVQDMHLIQFHPTAFYNKSVNEEQTFLISEAVRGDGAILFNEKGERFMESVHPMKELAPRDVVSKAIVNEIKKQIKPYVYLDITHKSQKELSNRFPTIYKYCFENGLDMSKDRIPVAPVAHYYMGGISIDLDGKTSINNLMACGECACTGVHGKNRLASNSLLEAVVFSRRTANYIIKKYNTDNINDQQNSEHYLEFYNNSSLIEVDINLKDKIKEWMMEYCGINRTDTGLLKGYRLLKSYLEQYANHVVVNKEQLSIMNRLLLSYTIIDYAIKHE